MNPTVTPRILVAVFGLLAFVVVSNNTAAAIAQPAIGQAFGAGPGDVGWVVFGFGTTFAIATALWGDLATRLGVGSSLAVGVLLFSGGSAVAALAPSLPVLIGARAVQGFGAGAIPTLSATAIALQFDGPARSRAIGTVIAGVPGTAVGCGSMPPASRAPEARAPWSSTPNQTRSASTSGWARSSSVLHRRRSTRAGSCRACGSS
jgi:MFS family permease